MSPPSDPGRAPNRASILARLRNRARTLGLPPDQMLLLYCLEGFLARLSASPYHDQFVLKGGLSLYGRFGSVARPTRDIDLVMREVPETPEQLIQAIRNIAATPLLDGLEFDLDSLNTRALNEAAEGLGVRLVARFGGARPTVHIDVSSGSVITPGPVELAFPTLLGEQPHSLLMYPLETVVAEKYAAAVELGVGNTRLKDFYDLWYILSQASLDPVTLRLAIERTFAARGTALEGARANWEALSEHAQLSRLWEQFLVRNGLKAPADFAEVVGQVSMRLRPVLE